jgi:hypothetical protein
MASEGCNGSRAAGVRRPGQLKAAPAGLISALKLVADGVGAPRRASEARPPRGQAVHRHGRKTYKPDPLSVGISALTATWFNADWVGDAVTAPRALTKHRDDLIPALTPYRAGVISSDRHWRSGWTDATGDQAGRTRTPRRRHPGESGGGASPARSGENVPRNIFPLLFPTPLCGRRCRASWSRWRCSAAPAT